MSLETLLTEYIFDFSVSRIITIDDVTGVFKMRRSMSREKSI